MKYKYLQIITRIYKGGAEEAVLQLIRTLASHDIHCDLAVGNTFNRNLLDKFPLPPTCNIYHIPELVRDPNPLKDLQAIGKIKKLLQRNHYDIVNTHTAKAGILGRYAAYKAKTPVIIHTVHTLTFGKTFAFPFRFIYKFLEKFVSKFTDHYIFVSKDLENKYIQANISNAQKSSTIYVGIDLTKFRESSSHATQQKKMMIRKKLALPIDPQEIMLGCIGRITETKKQETLIRALPKLMKYYPKIHLLLFGGSDNKYLRKLHTLCKKLHIHEKVHFLGFHSNLWEIISIIDVHCFASIHEGLPLVLVQCSAAGIPSVCFHCSGVEEIIEHEKSGFIIAHSQQHSF